MMLMRPKIKTISQILQPAFFFCAFEKSPTSEKKISDSPFEKYRLSAVVFWQ